MSRLIIITLLTLLEEERVFENNQESDQSNSNAYVEYNLNNNENSLEENGNSLEEYEQDKNIEKTNEESAKASASRLSLFDNINERREKNMEKTEEKKGPSLNFEAKSENHENDEFNQDSHMDSIDTQSQIIENDEENDENKDDELLDIPTFLRRQAN